MRMMLRAATVMAILGTAATGWASDTGTITVSVSLGSVIAVSLDTSTWNIGPIALGGSNGPATFTATVGNTATKLEIAATNGAGGWALGATAGPDVFVVAVTNPAIKLTAVNQTLAASVAAYGNKSLALTYGAPTSDTKGGGIDQGFAITVKASAP